MRREGSASDFLKGNRGVALIIVLLVTALLVALIFEFAYGTRISLRAAVNFRDSQRAHYIARSGVNFVGLLLADNLKNGRLQDDLERDCDLPPPPLPFISGGDTVLNVCWEDEGGKLNISTVSQNNDTFRRLSKLFDVRGISQDNLDRISSSPTEQRKFYLLTELHFYLNSDDYDNVEGMLTVSPVNKINVNTASKEVLQSLGLSAGMAEMLEGRREGDPFKQINDVNAFLGPDNTMTASLLDVTSNVFKVKSSATVGGYTRQIEAVITRSVAGFTVNYWRVL